jgi:hypothetical protein
MPHNWPAAVILIVMAWLLPLGAAAYLAITSLWLLLPAVPVACAISYLLTQAIRRQYLPSNR